MAKDEKIKVKEDSKLRPPNLALKNKTKKEQPTINNDHTKKVKDDEKSPNNVKVSGFLEYRNPYEDMDFFSVVFQSSKKFHKEYGIKSFNRYKCAKGTNVCLTAKEEAKTRDIVLDPKDWAFGEADLLTSLNAEANGYTIKDNCLPYVNSKAECVKSKDLVKFYKTHLGAFVLVNHKQDMKEIKGVILDVVLREIPLEDGTKLYYSRGLLAINRAKDPQLAKAMDEGKIKFGSMGSFYSSVTCSYCGKVGLQTDSSDTRCIHLKMMKGQRYTKPDGGFGQIVEWWNPFDEEKNPEPIEFIEYSLLVCRDGKVGGTCSGVSPAWSGSVVSEKSVEGLKADRPIVISVEEPFLKKPAFQMFLKNKSIRIVK